MASKSSQFKVRFSIKDAPHGVPVTSLSKINEKLYKLLDAIRQNYQATTDNADQWIAINFGNHSVEYDVERVLSEEVVSKMKNDFMVALDFDLGNPDVDESKLDLHKYWIEAGNALVSENGKIKISIYKNGVIDKEKVRELTKAEATKKEIEIRKYEDEILERTNVFYGGVEGVISDWHKEGRTPHVVIEDRVMGVKVPCYYPDSLYEDVAQLFKKRTNVVYASGIVSQDKNDPLKMKVNVDRFIINEDYTFYREGDLQKFFGAAPDFAGGLSASEYIERGRYGKGDS